MKLRISLLGLILCLCVPAFAQTQIDVTKLTADMKTFIFNDNKNTVKNYIYQAFQDKTTCCGSDRIYLEVQIDPTGYVSQVKTLTGKNDCFKMSAIDVVKNVKWDASKLKGPKSVYFEIKPDISCSDDRANQYVQVEVFNNNILDATGMPRQDRVAASNTKPANQATAQPSTTPAETTSTTPANNTPAANTAVAENTTTTTKTEDKVSADASVADKPTATEEVKAQPTTNTTQPVAENNSTTTTSEQAPQATPAETVVAQANEKAATEAAKTEPTVSDTELAVLRAKMSELREEEEAAIDKERRKQAYIARRRAARDRARQRKLEAQQSTASAENVEEEIFDDSGFGGDDGGREMTRDEQIQQRGMELEQRYRQDISRLEDQRRRIEDEQRRLEEQRNQYRADQERIARERLRIEEQLLQAQEQSQQQREELELERLSEEERRLLDQKLAQEQDVQRLLQEIERLQREQDRKMEELRRQEEQINELISDRNLREQTIEAERLRRQKEQEAQLKVMELETRAQLSTSGSFGTRGTDLTSPGLEQALMAEDDSTQIGLLIREIAKLQGEIRLMQESLLSTQQGGIPSSIRSNPGSIGTSGTSNTNSGTEGAKNASEDRSWEGVKYRDPNSPSENYKAPEEEKREEQEKKNEVSNEFDPVRGYSPDPSHKESHANVAGPRFTMPEYGNGEGALKNYIKDKLRESGVCGLTQAFSEVTVDQGGKVVAVNVIKASNALVMLRLPSVLYSMKFKPAESRIPQTSYIEFKADILCPNSDGSNIDLKEVDSYIENN